MSDTVVVCSIIRDGMPFLRSYLAQVSSFTYSNLKVVVVEGDSRDGTYEALVSESSRQKNFHVKKLDTHSRAFGSVVHKERFRSMAASMNLALETALEQNPSHVLYFTADLSGPADLIERLKAADKDIVAPLILRKDGATFYDTWGFRKGHSLFQLGPGWALGCFKPRPPYHPCFRRDEVFEVDSAGSVFLIRSDVLKRGARFTPEKDVVGFCGESRKLGFRVWVDPRLACIHP